jgi:transposase InsO family protein
MAYDTNPRLPKMRARAVQMVWMGKTITETARYFGFSKSAVSKWCKKAPKGGVRIIPTESSAPKHHPWRIKKALRSRIVELRLELKGRCAQVIQDHLKEEGFKVSVRTIQRELERHNLLKKYSPWKKRHISGERPKAEKPGDLVQIDTIHLMVSEKKRIYVYTMIDVASRVAFARADSKATSGRSVKFLEAGSRKTTVTALVAQSDHGPEFGSYFTRNITSRHRHSRVRKPNDNAHIERFNRTIQDECISKLPRDVKIINKELTKYLTYYNTKRKHLGIGLKTPAEALKLFPS